MDLKIIVFLLLAAVCIQSAKDSGLNDCGVAKVPCQCLYGWDQITVTIKVKKRSFEDPTTGKMVCETSPPAFEACYNISCNLDTTEFQSRDWENDVLSDAFPRIINYPLEEHSDTIHRFKRYIPCEMYPMEYSYVSCLLWPNYKRCTLNCIDGYAHAAPGGSVRSKAFGCRYTENVWTPPLEDCRPYWNCKLYVEKHFGFDVKCYDSKTEPPYCNISCFDYGTQSYGKFEVYKCINGNFEPPLPDCVGLVDDNLLPAPNETSTKLLPTSNASSTKLLPTSNASSTELLPTSNAASTELLPTSNVASPTPTANSTKVDFQETTKKVTKT